MKTVKIYSGRILLRIVNISRKATVDSVYRKELEPYSTHMTIE